MVTDQQVRRLRKFYQTTRPYGQEIQPSRNFCPTHRLRT